MRNWFLGKVPHNSDSRLSNEILLEELQDDYLYSKKNIEYMFGIELL
jgi:hypothetical protein